MLAIRHLPFLDVFRKLKLPRFSLPLDVLRNRKEISLRFKNEGLNIRSAIAVSYYFCFRTRCCLRSVFLGIIIGSLSNHDDDGNKNPTNLHIWQWKTVFLHALHVLVLFCFCFVLFFWHFVDVLVLFTTWNEQFCSWVDDVSAWWQMFNFVFLCPKRWFQLNSRTVRTHFLSIMSLNNWKMIAETRSYFFRWRSGFRRRRVYLSSLISQRTNDYHWPFLDACGKLAAIFPTLGCFVEEYSDFARL